MSVYYDMIGNKEIDEKIAIGFIILAVVLSPILISCTGKVGETKELESVQVKEYEGEKLSSVNDFRENSIKGPQYINIDNYRLEITGLVNSPQSYSYDEVIDDNQSYKKVRTLDCVEGWSVTLL